MAELTFRNDQDPTTLTFPQLVDAFNQERRMSGYASDELERRQGVVDRDAEGIRPDPLPSDDRAFLYSVNSLIAQRDRYDHDARVLREELARRGGRYW